MFEWKKPTVQMLGRWQPWHDGHTELFKRALLKTGQVCIMYRDVGGVDAGVEGQSCLLYTSPSPRDKRQSRMPSSA